VSGVSGVSVKGMYGLFFSLFPVFTVKKWSSKYIAFVLDAVGNKTRKKINAVSVRKREKTVQNRMIFLSGREG
jgi:hypothetical protein